MGDVRYGGMTNEQLANYLGIDVHSLQMFQEVTQGNATPADIALLQQWAGQSGGGPMGGANRLRMFGRTLRVRMDSKKDDICITPGLGLLS